MKSFETQPVTNRSKLSRGARLALAVAVLAPSAAACGETNTAPVKSPTIQLARSQSPAKNSLHPTHKISVHETAVSTPEITAPAIVYAESAKVDEDVQAIVTMIDAMDPYNRTDIKVNTNSNPDGSYSQSFTKVTTQLFPAPTALTATVVYGPNKAGSPVSGGIIEAVEVRVNPVNPEDFNLGSNTSAIKISRIGADNWDISQIENDATLVQASTEPNTGRGADNRLTQDVENSVMFNLTYIVDGLNTRIPYTPVVIPGVDVAPISPQAVVELPGAL